MQNVNIAALQSLNKYNFMCTLLYTCNKVMEYTEY